MQNSKQSNRGFTLIELLVVVAIISLLSSVVLASLNSARAKARDARRLSDIKQISTAIYLVADKDGGNFPATGGYAKCLGTSGSCWGSIMSGDSSLNIKVQEFLSSIPQDPLRTTGKGDRYLYAGPESLVAKDCDNVGRGDPYPKGPFIIYIPDSTTTPSSDALCLGTGFPACCGVDNCQNGWFCTYKIQ